MHKYPHSSAIWRRHLNPSARDDAEQRMLPSAAEPEHLVRIERKGISETHKRGAGGGRRRRWIRPRRRHCVHAGFVKTADPDDVNMQFILDTLSDAAIKSVISLAGGRGAR